MMNKKERFAGTEKGKAAAAALTLLLAGSVTAAEAGRSQTQLQTSKENQMTTTQSKFFCNIKALTPEERAHHKQLGDKLMAARKEIVEMPNGYEFQFSPHDVSLAELAEWVAAESKCCPFFDFHIDLEREGKWACLRLTGEEGIKAFIKAEFKIENAK